jgi:hypothetical protein
MEPKANASNRPIIVATAALTVAVGLTVASLGGYLRPRDATPVVPVVTEQPVADPTPSEPILASNTPHEEREHAGRRHHEHGHDHHEDD